MVGAWGVGAASPLFDRQWAYNARNKAQGGMMLRTIEDWKTLLRDKSPRDAAQRILRDIPHYRKGGGYECEDIEQLANALQAFVSPRGEEPANGP